VNGTIDKRMSVETAFQQIRADCNVIKGNLKLQPIISKPDDFIRIKDEGLRLIKANKRGWPYYEIGFWFIVNSTSISLKNTIGLTKDETVLLRASMGRVHYNPPSREFIRMKNAADALNEDKKRSAQILDAWRTEVQNLWSMRKLVSMGHSLHGTDMFDNPFFGLALLNAKIKDFGDVAADDQYMIQELKADESTPSMQQPFYK
jgi:hypothetical protein